jgi:hypothetical protein
MEFPESTPCMTKQLAKVCRRSWKRKSVKLDSLARPKEAVLILVRSRWQVKLTVLLLRTASGLSFETDSYRQRHYPHGLPPARR